MNPPMKYPRARVIALVQAWLQSGSDSLWWKVMRNSRSRSGEACREVLIGAIASSGTPCDEKMS